MNFSAALRRLAAATSLSTAALLAAETPAPRRAEFIDPAAPAVADLRQTGEAAFAAVGKQLVTALNAALATGGPAAAVAFCNTQAIPLTTAPRPDQPRVLAVKRTSLRLRLRNPANAPDPAERLALDHVAKLVVAGQPPPPVLVQRIETSGAPMPEWRVYRPIVTKPECLACHGDPATQPPELRTALQTRYPADAATGYTADQCRGLFRVTVSPASAPAVAP
jgi:hypothetical protein